jgi:hypothetical protein
VAKPNFAKRTHSPWVAWFNAFSIQGSSSSFKAIQRYSILFKGFLEKIFFIFVTAPLPLRAVDARV